MGEEFERQHPRHGNGRFRPKGSAAQPAVGREPKRPTAQAKPRPGRKLARRLRSLDDEDLALTFVRLAAEPDRPGRELLLEALDAELGRRERRTSTSRSAAIADLVHGEPITEAMQAAALVDAQRRPGERRRDTLRRMHREHTAAQYVAAEAATRGHLLSPAGRARNVDPVTLFSGPGDRARRYASDELKAWWEQQGGRPTFETFAAQYANTAARNTAKAARQRGAGRDFGV